MDYTAKDDLSFKKILTYIGILNYVLEVKFELSTCVIVDFQGKDWGDIQQHNIAVIDKFPVSCVQNGVGAEELPDVGNFLNIFDDKNSLGYGEILPCIGPSTKDEILRPNGTENDFRYDNGYV